MGKKDFSLKFETRTLKRRKKPLSEYVTAFNSRGTVRPIFDENCIKIVGAVSLY